MNDTMVQRKYSVAEIDAMRASVETISKVVGGTNWGADFVATVEQRLRTYMVGGADPAELEAVAKEAEEKYEAGFKQYRDALMEQMEEHQKRIRQQEREVQPPRKPRIFSSEWWG